MPSFGAEDPPRSHPVACLGHGHGVPQGLPLSVRACVRGGGGSLFDNKPGDVSVTTCLRDLSRPHSRYVESPDSDTTCTGTDDAVIMGRTCYSPGPFVFQNPYKKPLSVVKRDKVNEHQQNYSSVFVG